MNLYQNIQTTEPKNKIFVVGGITNNLAKVLSKHTDNFHEKSTHLMTKLKAKKFLNPHIRS